MRKLIAIFAAAAMVLSLAACNNESNDNNTPNNNNGTTTTTTTAAADDTTTTTTTAAEEEPGDDTSEGEENPPEEEGGPLFTPMEEIDAEAIDVDPLLHLDFETTDGLTAVEQAENPDKASNPDLPAFIITESSHEILLAEGQGASGNALYLDGKYGVDFDMPQIDDDVYTISFWYNADRVATFGPVVQMGRNIYSGDPLVSWVNFTKTTWGAADADIFPVAWNRNSAYDVFPWIYAMDNVEHGKREWCMVTLVVNGNRYIADDGGDRVETQFYINGQLMWDANAENMFYQGISPEIFAGDGLEGHIGINYWDTVYKGFIDELSVYNAALTPGQVKTLFEAGNPPETPVAPEAAE